MIEMHISHIPAEGTSDPWEVATAVVDGRKFVAKSHSSCEVKLARMLVAAGVPDQTMAIADGDWRREPARTIAPPVGRGGDEGREPSRPTWWW